MPIALYHWFNVILMFKVFVHTLCHFIPSFLHALFPSPTHSSIQSFIAFQFIHSSIHPLIHSFIHFIPSFIDVVAAFSCVLCSISCVSCSISSVRIVVTAFSFGIYRQLRWLPRSRACSVAFPAMGGLREDQLCLPRSPRSKSFHDSINYSTSKRSHPQSRRVSRSAIAPQ
jgi:hypothetical protein